MQVEYLQNGHYVLPYNLDNWKNIKEKLIQISKSPSLETIINCLLKLHSYTRGVVVKKFSHLYKFPEKKTIKIFASMANYILDEEQYYKDKSKIFPLFTRHNNKSHTFQKKNVVFLMCIICLCISSNTITNFKFKTTLTKQSDIAGIYGNYQRKIPFFLQYFEKVFDQLKTQKLTTMTIYRKKVISLRANDVLKNQDLLIPMEIRQDNENLDSQTKDTRIKVDFANRFIGGGTLNKGCVQQQIMFLNHIECSISTLLCQPMLDNQAIGLHGFKKYFKNTGYSTTTQFDGLQNFIYSEDQQHRLNDYIIGIDALTKDMQKQQYSQSNILRQVNKCIAGFSIFDQQFKISTGNWGCGVFKGNVQLKIIIQWIAASIVKRKLVYYPYNNKKLSKVKQIIKMLESLTIGKVFKIIIDYPSHIKMDVFEYINKTIKSNQ